MKLRLITVGRNASPWARDGVDDYAKRIKRFGGIEELHLKPERFRGQIEDVRNAEAKRILDRLKPRDRLIAVDERGETPTSHEFSKMLESGLMSSGSLVFAIGGPYGHGKAVRERAWKVLSLSSMVMNHQVARVMLYEQIYRAYTILKGMDYHH